MISVLQRVRQAHVEVGGQVIGRIGAGLLVLLCAEQGDGDAQAERLLAKVLRLRIFGDAAGKMNRSVQDVGGGLLIVSQFTLQPIRAAATARASAKPPRPPRGGACTSTSCSAPASCTRMCRPGSSPPTCRYTWSTTGR